MRRLKSSILTIAAAASLATPAAALAQNDRIIDTPAAWAYLYGATSSQISAQIGNGYRPFSIERVGAGEYDTVSVHNSGPYAVVGAAVTYGRTPASMGNFIDDNNYRLLDLEVYDNGAGSTLMTAIVVPNSGGTSTPAWGWLYNVSFSDIVTWMNDNPALRLIDLDVYTIGGVRYYSAVAVHNSGSNAQGWWYYDNITASEVTDALTTNGARLIDVELVSPGGLPPRYACVMVSSNPGGGWWYPALTSQEVGSLLAQNGARLSCLKRYTNALGQTRWAAAMVDNANAQTRRVRGYVDDALGDGSYGFMLKQVNGPVLAALNENFVYEPASMLKILHATYAVYRCSLGTDSLESDIFAHNRCNDESSRNRCPDPYYYCNAGDEPLATCVRWMMQISHNGRTRNIEERYGRGTLNLFAAWRGLANTRINHTMGCGPATNTFTCTDATSLYEQIADGSLFDSQWRDELIALMTSTDNSTYSLLNTIITQEAAGTDLTPAEIADFRGRVRFANKGGRYGIDGLLYKTEGAWASIPFKVNVFGNYAILDRQYAIAAFVHASTDDAGSNIVYNAKIEILREQIRAALESWDGACTTPVIASHPASRTATVGSSVSFDVDLAIGAGNPAYQWQRQPIGGAWGNITNVPGRFAGATTDTLTVSNLIPADEGRYRVIVSSGCGSDTSDAATLIVNASCPADFDNSGTLTLADFVAFRNAYVAGDLAADFDGSGTLTLSDFVGYRNAYVAGCP